jgi:hypothetical protein
MPSINPYQIYSASFQQEGIPAILTYTVEGYGKRLPFTIRFASFTDDPSRDLTLISLEERENAILSFWKGKRLLTLGKRFPILLGQEGMIKQQ